jgi:diaminopropionate ammonia-lyase
MTQHGSRLTSAVFRNPRYHADRKYGGTASEWLGRHAFRLAHEEICSWPGYRPTPLYLLPDVAKSSAVSRVWYKDEAGRFDLGSFKALGGAYGVFQAARRTISAGLHTIDVNSEDLGSPQYRRVVSGLTFVCATDGNHGRSVAWGAARIGARAAVFVHEGVSPGRVRALEALKATVHVVAGNYDDSLRAAETYASGNSRILVSDTSLGRFDGTARDVMAGYGVIADELVAQLGHDAPSHIFIQAGVGGLAGALCARLWQHYGPARPRFVVVEPVSAAGLFSSAQHGCLERAQGDLHTVMACLVAVEPSYLGWEILQDGAFAFMTVDDPTAIATMRLLAQGSPNDPKIVAGESGAAGAAALLATAGRTDLREALDLTVESTVVLIGTEGATDLAIYNAIVNEK